jgi:hypothetical protein
VSRGAIAFLVAALAAVAVAATVLVALVLVPAERRDPPENGTVPNGTAGAGEVTGGAPAEQPPAPTGDVTEAFRAFANEGEPFPPEWLVRTQRVYWAAGGALWADATMPRAPAERVRTIEQICLHLSAYVTERLRLDWHGVSVRAADGTALLTRASTTDPCRPAA